MFGFKKCKNHFLFLLITLAIAFNSYLFCKVNNQIKSSGHKKSLEVGGRLLKYAGIASSVWISFYLIKYWLGKSGSHKGERSPGGSKSNYLKDKIKNLEYNSDSDTDSDIDLDVRFGYGPDEPCYRLYDDIVDAGVKGNIRRFEKLLGICKFTAELLHCVCDNGHVDVVKLFLDRGANIEVTNYYDHTALHRACLRGHIDVVKLLLDKGANIEALSHNGQTPLYFASENGHLGIVRLLLDRGADYEAADCDRKVPLHCACLSIRSNIDIVRLILDWGANVDASNTDGQTLLHYACMGRDVNVVKLLVDRGADIETETFNNETPAKYAFLGGKEDFLALLTKNLDKQHELRCCLRLFRGKLFGLGNVDADPRNLSQLKEKIETLMCGRETPTCAKYSKVVELIELNKKIKIRSHEFDIEKCLKNMPFTAKFLSKKEYDKAVNFAISEGIQDRDGRTVLVAAAHYGKNTDIITKCIGGSLYQEDDLLDKCLNPQDSEWTKKYFLEALKVSEQKRNKKFYKGLINTGIVLGILKKDTKLPGELANEIIKFVPSSEIGKERVYFTEREQKRRRRLFS